MRSIALLAAVAALASCKLTFHAGVEGEERAREAAAPRELEAPELASMAAEPETTPAPGAPTFDGPPQAISLIGETLRQLVPPADEKAALDAAVLAAEHLVRELPSSEAYVWLGRRLSSAYRYVEAVQAFKHACDATGYCDPVALRYLGHRYITLRRLADAERVLLRGIELAHDAPPIVELRADPDPMKAHPVSIQHSLYYHLGVARFVEHRFEDALEAWQECLALSDDPDELCGATHWTYMTLRRLGRHDEARAILAPITPELDVRESKGYHRMCLMYKGLLAPEELIAEDESGLQRVTLGYGLAHWLLCEGRTEEAAERFRELAQSPWWMAFARIAAEAEVLRM